MWEEAFLKRWRKVALTTVVFVLTTVVILGRFPVVFLKSNTASLPMAELRHRMLQRTRLVNTTCHEYKSELLHHYAQWLGVSEYWQKVDPLLFVNPDVLVNRRQRLVWCKGQIPGQERRQEVQEIQGVIRPLHHSQAQEERATAGGGVL
ncbi:uncharacterized protein LOC135204814 isoform X4 [Macrobrachium nipponense]|uniref:uncharacterized protein LOC135204814 isoform X4 n=1 Tax=Macrobrachium nipponense TaxID=159736 RepID=UPI0030C87129